MPFYWQDRILLDMGIDYKHVLSKEEIQRLFEKLKKDFPKLELDNLSYHAFLLAARMHEENVFNVGTFYLLIYSYLFVLSPYFPDYLNELNITDEHALENLLLEDMPNENLLSDYSVDKLMYNLFHFYERRPKSSLENFHEIVITRIFVNLDKSQKNILTLKVKNKLIYAVFNILKDHRETVAKMIYNAALIYSYSGSKIDSIDNSNNMQKIGIENMIAILKDFLSFLDIFFSIVSISKDYFNKTSSYINFIISKLKSNIIEKRELISLAVAISRVYSVFIYIACIMTVNFIKKHGDAFYNLLLSQEGFFRSMDFREMNFSAIYNLVSEKLSLDSIIEEYSAGENGHLLTEFLKRHLFYELPERDVDNAKLFFRVMLGDYYDMLYDSYGAPTLVHIWEEIARSKYRDYFELDRSLEITARSQKESFIFYHEILKEFFINVYLDRELKMFLEIINSKVSFGYARMVGYEWLKRVIFDLKIRSNVEYI